MKKIYFIIITVIAFLPLYSQTLDWAYSIKSNTIQDAIHDISSNGTNRFAIYGFDAQNLDVKNNSAVFNHSGKFLSVYNDKAEIQWKKTVHTLSSGIKMTLANEVFVAGGFGGTFDFDPSENVFNLTGDGSTCFLQKFDANGKFLWAAMAQTGGLGSEIEQLADGRIIVSGRSDVAGKVKLSNNSTIDLPKGVFMLEFASDGKLLNAYSISVPAADGYGYVHDIASDASNNIYICGSLDGIADFNLGTATANNVKTHAYDAFVAKYNSNFELVWYKVFGDINVSPYGWDRAHSMAIDASGNIFIGGEFTWQTDFDPIANPGKYQLNSDTRTQTPSGFILQYNSNGNLNWVKKIGAPNKDTGLFGENRVRGIQLQGNNLYAWIETTKYCDVDPSAAEKIYTSTSATNIILASYSTDLSLLKSFKIDQALTYTVAAGIELLGNESIVVSGTFQKETDFDPTSGTKILKTDPNGMFYWADLDAYIAKYNFGTATKAQNLTSSEEIQIFPNPFKSEIRIKNSTGESIKQLKVYSLDGKLAFELSNPEAHISLEMLRSGLYLYEIITNENKSSRGKIIKQ